MPFIGIAWGSVMRNERQQATDKVRTNSEQRLSPELSEFLHMLNALEGQLREPSTSDNNR
jgi:hypothetical protein